MNDCKEKDHNEETGGITINGEDVFSLIADNILRSVEFATSLAVLHEHGEGSDVDVNECRKAAVTLYMMELFEPTERLMRYTDCIRTDATHAERKAVYLKSVENVVEKLFSRMKVVVQGTVEGVADGILDAEEIN